MDIIILGILLVTPMVAYLIYDYRVDKKRKEELLAKVINKEVHFNKLWITEPDGDGYQKLNVELVENGKIKNEVLAGHFDIPKISEKLTASDIKYSGYYNQ